MVAQADPPRLTTRCPHCGYVLVWRFGAGYCDGCGAIVRRQE